MKEKSQYEVVQAAEQAIKDSDHGHQLLHELLQGLESSEVFRPLLYADALSSAEIAVNKPISRLQLFPSEQHEKGEPVRLRRPVLMRGITI